MVYPLPFTARGALGRMVQLQIVARGIADVAVLEAMRSVPREMFLPDDMAQFAYEDGPYPIGEGQTISQPYVVALMAEAMHLTPADRVLEIGTGSGYAAAVLSRVVDHVYTVERYRSLVELARERFARLEYDNIEVLHGDGTLGWPEHAPYDAIVVTAGGPEVPARLREQLAVGGYLVMPIGTNRHGQELVFERRMDDDRFERGSLGDVRFVPLIGEEGWRE